MITRLGLFHSLTLHIYETLIRLSEKIDNLINSTGLVLASMHIQGFRLFELSHNETESY